ncbi:MAG: alpha/beta hydrolase [Candidatus Nanopelagicales bacterium]
MHQTVEVDQLRIAYRREGDGPCLVLLHGILQDSRSWRWQLDGLQDEFTVIAWDAPGCGQSDDPPANFRMAELADCLAAFLSALDVQGVHVVGLSLGTTIALELYRRHPQCVGSLTLASGYAGWAGSLPPDDVAQRLESCLQQSEQDASDFVPLWIPGILTESAPQELREEVIATMSDFHPEGFRMMARAMAEADMRDMLGDINVPTLLLYGEQDQRAPLDIARAQHSAIPTATLTTIPDVGHLLNCEMPDTFNDAVRKFSRSVSQPHRSGPRQS